MLEFPPIEITAQGLVNHRTGEVLHPPSMTTGQLATLRAEAAAAASLLRTVARMTDDELEQRVKEGLDVKQPVDGWEITRTVKSEWNKSLTREVLADLVGRGKITPAQVDALMPEVTERRPNGTALNKLVRELLSDGDVESAGAVQRAKAERYTFRAERGIDATAEAA